MFTEEKITKIGHLEIKEKIPGLVIIKRLVIA